MPHYLSISSSEFNARYNKLATYLSFDINANKPFSEIINELKNLFSSDAEILRTQADLDRKLFVLNRDENHKTFLHKAAAENNIRSLIFLRETGHDIDLTDGIHRTALYVACDQLKLISVQTLLRFGANPNKGNTQLVGGIRGDRTPLNAVINSELIDDRLVDINPDYERIAANIVKKLIAAGADVNLQTGNENFSAVHRAIINRKPLILQEIISSGKANFDLVNIDGETVLHMLVDYRSKDEKAREQPQMQEEKQMLDLLIPHIKSIDKQDKNDDTALHKAVTNSNVAVVEALYKKDHLFSGDEKLLSIQNNLGDTAIHEAIREAQRGPKILELLLRVATENDLSIKNNAGETAKEMAARLFKQANTIQNLAQTIANTAKNLDDSLHETEIDEVDLLRDINQLKEAIIKLNNHELNSQETLHSKASKALSLAIEGLLIDMDEITSLSNADPEDLVIRAQQLVADSTREFFEETYLTALKSVQQTEYLDWKNEKLRLPSSFPDLEVIDPNLLNSHKEEYFVAGELAYGDGLYYYNQGNFDEAIRRLGASTVLFREHYPQHLSLAKSYLQLGKAYQANNNLVSARENFKKSIEIYIQLKEYEKLETTYQDLAVTYIKENKSAVTDYETENQNILLNTNSDTEKLQAHLALAGLYKQINEHPGRLSLSEDDLSAYESYHYKESYKLTQGTLDNAAHVVLQGEFGISTDENLGTYNIRQCVAIVVHNPLEVEKKVVLSHFDQFSGPLSFMDQIRNAFPGDSKLDLYLTGGRDREGGKEISDNNIDQVLKQIYVYKERFDIKAVDIGNNPSPEAIVFDVKSRQLKPAMPNHPDSSLNSRVVHFMLTTAKDDYLYPPKVVDFTKSEAVRTKVFTPDQKNRIKEEYRDFDEEIGQTQGWNHDSKFSIFMEANKDSLRQYNFNEGLLSSELNLNNLQINPQVLNPVVNQPAEDVEMLDLDNLPINDLYGYRDLPEPRVNQENHDAMHIDDLDNIDLDDMAHTVGCVTTRRKREVGCVLDSEKIIEKLNIFPEEKQFEILQKLEIQKPNIGGNKQKEVTALIHNHRVTQHLEKIGRFSSSLIDMMFSEEAVANLLFKGDPTAAVKLAGLNIVNHGLLKASELLEKKRLLALATGMKDLGFGLGARVVTKGTSLLAGYDLFNQIKFLQNNSNDTDAKVAIASDGIQIGTDLLRGGIEVAEISSERFAAMGISIVAGPVGEIVVGMVMLGQRIYDKVEYVEEEKHHVRLSDWEKFKEGSRAFLFINPEAYISRMIQKATEYEHRLALQSQLFQKNLAIKHIIIPGIERNGEKCRVVAEKSSCGDTRSIFITTCTKNVTICDPIFTDIINNSVYFQDKLEGFQLTRLIIKPPEGNELLCVPIETDGNGIVLTEHAYACDDAIGLTNTNNTVGEIAYFNLGLGEDHAVGFTDIPNVFITNNGAKDFEGGEQDDSFIVQATQVWTGRPKDREGMGGLDGGPGSDSLFLEGFQPITDRIKVYFDDGDAGYLKYGNTTLATNRIEKLFGGTIPLDVTAACTTEEIGMLGGTTLNNSDTLLIPKNSSCDYNLKMHLRPNSNVTNEAEVGNFIYYILPGNGIASISVAQNNLNTQHQFVFNASISEISSLVFSDNQQPQVTKLHFIQGMQFQLNTNLSASTNLYFMEGKTSAELKRGYKNLYLFLTTDQSIENIMQIYPAIAHRLNMISIINTSRNETVVIGHNGQEVMQNNPSAKKTYLNGNGGEGLFVMDNGSADSFRPPLNEVVIYHAKNDTHIDSLDFRKLHAKIQKLNATAEVFFTAPNKRNKLGNDVLLQLVMHPKNSLRRIRVMDIYLKDALVNHWYKKFLHILLDVAPYKIAGPRLNLHLKPVSFPVNADSMSIGVKNIEEKTEMIIPSDHDLHNFAFYHDNRTNLIFTNSLSNSSDIVKPLTILFENFYAEPKLATLVIKFSNTNTKIRLKNKVTLKGIADFNQVWQARKHALQADSSAIIKGQRNFTSIHKNVTDTQVWQRYYISNDINASSIEALTDDNYVEDNELRLSRRRRSIERSAQPLHSNAAAHHNGIIQKTFKAVNSVMNSLFSSNFEDKILDMADHYEKSQYPIKALSKGAKHSRRKAVKSPLKQVNDSTKQKILESPRQVQNLVLSNKTFKKTDRIQAHKKSAAAETCKRTSLFKPVQTNESYNPQNTRGNKQNSYANHNQIKVDQIASGNLHKIGHQTKQLHSKLLVKASLAGENHQHSYQQARQQAGKSGISQVTATSNVNATLLLFNVMSRYKCQQPLNAKVARWSEQVDRQKQKISGKPMGLRF